MAITYKRVDLSNNIFSPGSFLGSTASQSLIQDINLMGGGQIYFGSANDPFKESHQMFLNNIIQKLDEVDREIVAADAVIKLQDIMKPIVSVDDINRGIPPCMYQPILSFDPIRTLHRNGLIQGFNIPSEEVEFDVFGNMLPHHEFIIDPDKTNGVVSTEYLDIEPDTDEYREMKDDAIDIVTRTREFLTSFLRGEYTKRLDPTSIPGLDLRG